MTYSKAKGEIPLCTIPSHEMLAVERVDESAFGMKFVSVKIGSPVIPTMSCAMNLLL